MKSIKELNLGYSDAQNYALRKNKQMFSEVFVKNTFLDKLLNPSVYYLIGEKGTGKTAYAVFLSNQKEYNGTKSILKFISSTDYEKFHELKHMGKIDVSGYVDVWKAIIMLLLAKSITDDDRVVSAFTKSDINDLIKAIDEYYSNAFSPEIISAFKIVDNTQLAAKLMCKYAEIGGSTGSSIEVEEQRLQMNLYTICNVFSNCLASLKLKRNFTMFIDGIDVRPNQIPYDEYLNCIKGLANACWTLNTELFANVQDSKGQFRVVLLLRPDIFNSLNLQNATNKLVDNSVYLDWRTTYTDYPSSNLYKMANNLLLFSQDKQNKNKETSIWEQYFDWEIEQPSSTKRNYNTAFMEFLKISLSRPRDIQRILALLQELMEENGVANDTKFDLGIYSSNRFQNMYSEYFLGSLKDQLSFYYSDEDYHHFIKFFDYFNRSQFSYSEYETAYKKFVDYILDNAKEIPKFVEEPKEFLQFLYDCNVITAIEKEKNGKVTFHFSYRDKSPSNIAPKVKTGENISYRFHYGLYKKTSVGRY